MAAARGGRAGDALDTDEKVQTRQGGGREAEKKRAAGEDWTTMLIAAGMLATVAGNIVGARYWRRNMAENLTRAAERKEADRLFREAAARARAKYGYGSGARQEQQQQQQHYQHQQRRRDNTNTGGFYGGNEVAMHLDALGIASVNASEAEVKAAYRESVLRLHPDRNSDSSEVMKKVNEQEFKRVSQAYAWLEHHHFRPDRFK